MTSTRMSPNQREVLSAISTITNVQEYLSSTLSRLNVNATISGTGAFNLTQVGGAAITLGQTTMASSLPVTIASDNTGPVKIWDGTNTTNVLKSDGTAVGQNGLLTAGSYQEIATSVAGSLNADILPSTNVSGYKEFSIQFQNNALSGTITVQGSNDNVNWSSVGVIASNNVNTNYSTTITPGGPWIGPIAYKFLRVRITAYTSGAVLAGTCMLFTTTSMMHTTGVTASQNGTWTVGANSATGSAIPANAFYIGIRNTSSNLTGWASGDRIGDTNTGGESGSVAPLVYNGSNWDRTRSIINATNSVGTGIAAAGILAQFDDTSPTAITENQFGNLRMSANRNLYNTIRDAAGNERGANVGANNDLKIGTVGVVSSVNSSTATLLSGAVFTGTSEEVKDYASIQVSTISNVASATDGLSLQQSSDGTNWDITDTYTTAAATGKVFGIQPAARFFRVVYTNGGTNQASFRLQTVYHTEAPNQSSQRSSDGYTNETDLTQVWAFNSLWNGSTWDRVKSGGVTGMQGVSLQASSSGGWSFTNISTSTTTTVKSGAGTLHLISVNTLGTVASTATIYDNTAGSGTIIAIINTLALSGSFTYDIAFATGCTIVTTGTSPPNLTIAYK